MAYVIALQVISYLTHIHELKFTCYYHLICYTSLGYEGVACQRTVCPDDCNGRGTCWPERILASNAGTNTSYLLLPHDSLLTFSDVIDQAAITVLHGTP